MATLSPTRVHRRIRENPLALWHLLSLDAPTVAALWTSFIAASAGIALPRTSVLAMATAVWMLYAADRLLDARHLLTNPLHTGDLEHRHRFHHRHRSAFLLGILAASIALAILIPRLQPEAIRLYLILGTLLAGYFILIHVTGSAHRLPKEIAVGLFFSAAVFIPTIAPAPTLRPTLAPAAALLALLCSLNCLFIYSWEHPVAKRSPQPRSHTHPLTRLALRYLRHLTVTLTCISLLLPHTPLTLAIGLSALLLLLLDAFSSHLAPLTLRATADLALTTPVLFLPYLVHHR